MAILFYEDVDGIVSRLRRFGAFSTRFSTCICNPDVVAAGREQCRSCPARMIHRFLLPGLHRLPRSCACTVFYKHFQRAEARLPDQTRAPRRSRTAGISWTRAHGLPEIIGFFGACTAGPTGHDCHSFAASRVRAGGYDSARSRRC